VELGELARAGVVALSEGRSADAVDALLPVATNEDLANQADMVDLRARVCSLLAQALFDEGDIDAAEHWVGVATQLAARSGDDTKPLAELRQRIAVERASLRAAASRAESLARLADTPLAALLIGITDPDAMVDVLLRKAAAAVEVGRGLEAAELAERAIAVGTDRAQVLARLIQARVRPDDAETLIIDAWRVADTANSQNLIAATARAATLANVTLPNPD
jgi:hypothetical protein